MMCLCGISKVLLWNGLRFSTRILPRVAYSQVLDREESAVKYTHLLHRQIISLEGPAAAEFLQGIVTNDVTLLPEMKCMYAMVLNQHGRVINDIMLYHQKSGEFNGILLECEKNSAETLMKTLKFYKLRKKLSINLMDNLKVIQAMPPSPQLHFDPPLSRVLASGIDPRTPLLGHRILIENIEDTSENIDCDVTEYHRRRIQTGIPEGSLDLPSGDCLPLECNLDYMNGVSFHKGCYIGQELTARTKFTGVIRKRLLPVTIKVKGQIESGEAIYTGKGKKAGKFRSMHPDGEVGLALVRLSYLNEKLVTKDGQAEFECHVPTWWPFKDGTEFSDGVCGPTSDD